ncbi:hypothetical protein AWV80_23490 [Cupriavidus sp. UYMU48A]|nr:hypothetical protein AWV80_23490 [Cupriavidus sp. UYMU48A]
MTRSVALSRNPRYVQALYAARTRKEKYLATNGGRTARSARGGDGLRQVPPIAQESAAATWRLR